MKTALITGAGGAIGSAVAEEFAKQGYALALNYCKSREKTELLAKRLSAQLSVPAMAVYADVANSADVSKMVEKTLSELGHIDVLVNNSGIAEQRLFTDITDEAWRRMMSVNLDGVFYTSREALKDMLRRHSGAIINISSMWGQVGASCEVHYSAAKAGVIGFTKALAKEVAPSNIRVNCIAPGVVKSEMLSQFSQQELDVLAQETPLQKIGSASEIADCAAFLASDKAAFITGQVIGVNGGFVI